MEENKELNDFIRKSIKEVGLEKASDNFTDSVLSKIRTVTDKSEMFAYKPLISKKVWWFFASIFIGLVGYLVLGNPDLETNSPYVFALNKLAAVNLSEKILNLPVSNTLVYGSLAIAFFVWLQVLLIKHRFNKRYALS